jgi:type II secretory ATPase GspE/PulE/Tfp pilus assembly ATPase PilB-like protein
VGELREAASKGGMLTLRDAGMLKVHAGFTTIEEVVRETAVDY